MVIISDPASLQLCAGKLHEGGSWGQKDHWPGLWGPQQTQADLQTHCMKDLCELTPLNGLHEYHLPSQTHSMKAFQQTYADLQIHHIRDLCKPTPVNGLHEYHLPSQTHSMKAFNKLKQTYKPTAWRTSANQHPQRVCMNTINRAKPQHESPLQTHPHPLTLWLHEGSRQTHTCKCTAWMPCTNPHQHINYMKTL